MNKNTVWILFQEDLVAGVFTSYRKAVQTLMTSATLPIVEFNSYSVDYFTDKKDIIWSIEEFELDNV